MRIVLWTAPDMSSKWPQTQKAVDEFSVLDIDDDYGIEATAVLHPFGRGQFKELAERAIIPDILLDELIKTHRERDSLSTTWKLGGAARSKFKGVAQPGAGATGASGGRARALRLRAERYAQPLRRPGQQSSKVSISFSKYNEPCRILKTTCIQISPLYKDHSVVSQ